jgi:tetratricopeptide (TPR) repeat protein
MASARRHRSTRGDHDAAIARIRHAIGINPDHASAHSNLGAAFEARGRLADALDSYQSALRLQPDSPTVLQSSGKILLQLDCPAEALTYFERLLTWRPEDVALLFCKANALLGAERYEDAITAFQQVLRNQPDHAQAYNNCGNAYGKLNRLAEALECYDKALQCKPDYDMALNNRAGILQDLNRHDEALASYEEALEINPDNAKTLNNFGVALAYFHRHEEALTCYEKASRIAPDFATVHFNESLSRLAMGDFLSGWKKYAWRFKANGTAFPAAEQALWQGQNPSGKTLLLVSEQGLGDTLQFCRYALPLARTGARVMLQVPASLQRLLARMEGVTQVAVPGETLPAFDAWSPLLSLPQYFHTTLDSIPAQVPYLRANEKDMAFWHTCLEQDGTLQTMRVGLVWAGNARRECGNTLLTNTDARRSMRLQHMAAFARTPHTAFYSLQKGEQAAQAGEPPPSMRFFDHTDRLNDFADTAALIMCLDLVISVDTSVAHLAGALGKPVWLLSRFDSCWRWLRGRNDSPWYPTMRIFRQPAPGKWDQVIDEVAGELATYATAMKKSRGRGESG